MAGKKPKGDDTIAKEFKRYDEFRKKQNMKNSSEEFNSSEAELNQEIKKQEQINRKLQEETNMHEENAARYKRWMDDIDETLEELSDITGTPIDKKTAVENILSDILPLRAKEDCKTKIPSKLAARVESLDLNWGGYSSEGYDEKAILGENLSAKFPDFSDKE